MNARRISGNNNILGQRPIQTLNKFQNSQVQKKAFDNDSKFDTLDQKNQSSKISRLDNQSEEPVNDDSGPSFGQS